MVRENLYGPLRAQSSIRLFKLMATDHGQALSGQLVDANLDDKIAYEALSYVWGSEANKVDLDCDGFKLPITRNLSAALKRLARPATDRMLWIDSVCINQANNAEKGIQVKLMDKIYSNASNVLIWLGEENEAEEDTSLALECISTLNSKINPRIQELRDWQDYAAKNPKRDPTSRQNADLEISTHFGLPGADSVGFKALKALLKRPWFFRAWTFQESALARNKAFLVSPHLVSDSNVSDTVTILAHLHRCTLRAEYIDYGQSLLPTMVANAQIFETAQTGSALLSEAFQARNQLLALLEQRRGAGCKNARDLIYSLLGVAKDNVHIEPQYDETVEYVFADATVAMIHKQGSLKALGKPYGEIDHVLPSWVPDWRLSHKDRGRYHLFLSFSSIHHRRYSCTGSSRAKVQLSPDHKTITLEGLDFDQIRGIRKTKAFNMGEVYRWVSQVFTRIAPRGTYRPTNEPAYVVMERLICTDLALSEPGFVKPRWGKEQQSGSSKTKDSNAQRLYADELINNMWGKAIALTKNNNFGVVPDWAEPGDKICLLMGGEVPLVLRHDPIDDKYTLVGECYIHGYMDGEGFVEARRVAEFSGPVADLGGDLAELAGPMAELARIFGRQAGLAESDTSWLESLHEGPLPFPTTQFTIK